MKIKLILLFALFFAAGNCFAQEGKNILVLDDFEGEIVAGPNGTIDAGAGNGSSVEVSGDKANKMSGEQSLKITYDAVSGGYIWVARGYGLDVKGAAKWINEPDKIDWTRYGAISLFMLGTGSGAKIAFDVKDSGNEIFRFMLTDDSNKWKPAVCPFDQFFPRGDWQPSNAVTNGTLDFPIKSFQFEPIAINKSTVNIDEVILEPLN